MTHLLPDGSVSFEKQVDRRIPVHANPNTEQARVRSLIEVHHSDDPNMLAIRHLEQTDKQAYDSLPAHTRMAYGFWCEGEAHAKAAGRPTG